MSSLVYPVLPGITFDSVRSIIYNTGKQQALSGKESRIAYQVYPLLQFELTYELLRDYVTPSDLKSLIGLFMSCRGQYDTFLYSDPVFNTVAGMYFATGDGITTTYQIVAAFANSGGAFGMEIIQNFNGTPQVFVNGTLQTPGTFYTLGATGIVTFLAGHIPPNNSVLTWAGSFFYRCRFDTDQLDVTQFMNKFWSTRSLKLRQVKL